MSRIIIILILIFWLPSISCAQDWSQMIDSAEAKYEAEEYDSALELFKQSVETAKKEYGHEHIYYRFSLSWVVHIYLINKQYGDAIPITKELLGLLNEAIGKDSEEYIDWLALLALLKGELGLYDEALTLYRDALELSRAVLHKGNEIYQEIIIGLAILYVRIEQYEKARPLILEALEFEKKDKIIDHEYFSNIIDFVYEDIDATGGKLEDRLFLLEIIEESIGKHHPLYIFYLKQIAESYNEIELFEKALPLYVSILELTEKVFGDDHYNYLFSMRELAEIYFKLDQVNNAIELYEQVLYEAESILGREDELYGMLFGRLAFLYSNNMNYDKADNLYMRALEHTEVFLGKDHETYAWRLFEIGDFYERFEKYDDALKVHTEALKYTEKIFGKNHEKYGNRLANVAFMYQTLGEYEKAMSFYREAMENAEYILGYDHEVYGRRLYNLGYIYELLEEYDKAFSLYSKALAHAEEVLGRDHETFGDRLFALGHIYEKIGEHDKALPLHKEALQNAEKSLGKYHETYLFRLDVLASFYRSRENYKEALQLYIQAVELAEIIFGKSHENYLYRLANLAFLYQLTGKYDKAISLYTEIIDRIEVNYGTEHEQYGRKLRNLGNVYQTTGQYEKSLEMLQLSLEYINKTFGEEHFIYAAVLNDIGLVYSSIGNHEKSVKIYYKALDATNVEDPSYVNIIGNLASVYTMLGDFEKAISLNEEVIALTEKNLGQMHSEYALSLNNISVLYAELGQYEQAINVLLEARQITEKILGKAHNQYGLISLNIANMTRMQGIYEAALAYAYNALENFEQSIGSSHDKYGRALNLIGLLYAIKEDYEKSIKYHMQALGNAEENFGKSNIQYGIVLMNIGALYYRKKEYNTAIEYLNESLKIVKQNYGKDHSHYGNVQMHLYLVYSAIGKHSKILKTYYAIIENLTNEIQKMFLFMTEKEKENYLSQIIHSIDLFLSYFIKHIDEEPRLAAYALEIELLRNGLVLSSSMRMRSTILQTANEDAIRIFDDWLAIRNIIAKNHSLPQEERSVDFEDLENEANLLEQKLTRLSSSFSREHKLAKSWVDVKRSLGKNEAAIQFSHFVIWEDKKWTDKEMYVAFVIHPDQEYPNMIPLFYKTELENIINRENLPDQQFISQLYRTIRVSTDYETNRHGEELYKLLWQPLNSYLDDVKKVYFSPSGILHEISFAALPIDNGVLLSDKYDLVQLSNISMKSIDSSEYSSAPNSIALFGGIDYDSDTEDLIAIANQFNTDNKSYKLNRSYIPDSKIRGTGWSYLPGTYSEVVAIKEIAVSYGADALLFTSSHAAEEAFKSLAGFDSPDVLHIATHGFFFPDPSRDNSLYDNHLIGGIEGVVRASDNPLFRSGLVFAGANHAWVGHEIPNNLEDGILTAFEVSNLFFPTTKLAVLSACETGLGEIKGSEGVFGLQRAFKMAGVEYLLMSLWKVPDKETSEFMQLFYEAWFSGNSIEEAFWMAQDQMKSRYRDDPFKWAAFVLIR